MEETKEAVKEGNKKCCCCSAVLGVLVIVFAWWKVSWAAIALTILGVLIIAKEAAKACCCKGAVCKTEEKK